MIKLTITLLSTLIFSLPNIAWAHPAGQLTEVNSYHKAVLERAAHHNHSQVATTPSAAYTHESEKNNSLPRAVLALQGTKMNLVLNGASDVSYSRYTDTRQINNSLFLSAMEK